jgi:A/G-specific adenine glycosylase
VGLHGGQFPGDSARLAQLPGIGRSTAAAIAAFCFGERAAILDGNVKRVLTRVLGFGEDLAKTANERALWARAEALLPEDGIEAYTQGVMDLGAGVCTVRRPQCLLCPLQEVCVARREGRPEAYPVKTRKLKRGLRDNALLCLSHADRWWLCQRPDQGVWAGLWALPEFASPFDVETLVGSWPGQTERLPEFEHVLTHLDWRLRPLRHTLPAGCDSATLRQVEAQLPSGRWVAREQALSLGLPAPIRKLLLQQAA